MDISIIIPVYNAEKYLKRCVDSVLKSLKNSKVKGEILLINNNSTDKSNEIIKDYEKSYPKIIQALSCKVSGASAVRNFGVKKARGEYIWFIDADDTISEGAILELINQTRKKDVDIVMMGVEKRFSDGGKKYLSVVDVNNKDYKSRFVYYGAGPWQVLIRRKWWESNKFSFKEGIIHEDMELMSALILYTDCFASIDEPLYHYYQNTGSVLRKKSFNPNIFDIFPALEGLYQKFVDKKAEKKYHDELEWFFIWNLLIDSARDFAQFPEGKPGFKRSREALKKYFPKWRKNRFLKQKPLKVRILVRLNYYK